MERWGACHFLCMAQELTAYSYCRFLRYQDALLQSFLAPALPTAAFAKGEVVETYLARSTPEPGLSICSTLHGHRLALSKYGLNASHIPSQVTNVLMSLGMILTPGTTVDPIAEILRKRYRILPVKSWHRLLGREYIHAVGLLKQAEATFDSGRSHWLLCQNSFNQTIFIALQHYLHITRNPAACKIVDRNGQFIDFGVTLDVRGPFSRHFPTIATCFREMNKRRNNLPAAHPYEKKSTARSQHLKAQERNVFVAKLRAAYADFINLMPS